MTGPGSETTTAFAGTMRDGGFFVAAARAAGVPRQTAYDWMIVGEQALEDYDRTPAEVPDGYRRRCAQFAQAVRQAEAEAEASALAVVLAAGRGEAEPGSDWRASAWYLERRHQTRWGGRRDAAEDPVELRRQLCSGAQEELTTMFFEALERANLPPDQADRLATALKEVLDDYGAEQPVDAGHRDGG